MKTETQAFDLPGQVLRLTLSKLPFEVMLTGEKTEEYRRPSNWILSRLNQRDYDYVLFTNGYGADKPWFACKAMGWDEASEPANLEFSNGLQVAVAYGDIILHLGPVVASGNLKPAALPTLTKGTGQSG